MKNRERLALSPMERRAHDLAEALLLCGFPLRHYSYQIPGLARILIAFAENELMLAERSGTVVGAASKVAQSADQDGRA